MTATNPVKDTIEYLKEDRDFHYAQLDQDELFEKCKNSYWIPYEIGIYVTALARLRLYEGIKLAAAGQNNVGSPEFSDFVYCDTDSVKYIGSVDWAEYNQLRMEDSKRNGGFAVDKKGRTHYLGVYEEIGGHLHVTIAGVDKKLGGAELAKKGGIDALQDGFVFREAGGLCAKYNDFPATTEYKVDGHWLQITSNCYLCQSEYTLGTLELYKRILYMSKIDLDRIARVMYNEYCIQPDDI